MNSKLLSVYRLPGVGRYHFWLMLVVLCLSGKAWSDCPGGIDIPITCAVTPPDCSYAATPSQVISPDEEISFTGSVPGNLFWELAPGTGCSGSSTSITCLGMVITLPTGATTTGAPQTDPVILNGTAQLALAESQFTLTVTDADDTSRTCNRVYRPRVTSAGGGWGDPHITTVDGVNYDFQSVGEFIALRGEDIEIQTRQTAVSTQNAAGANAYTGIASCVSLYSAVALRVGPQSDFQRVTIQPNISGMPDPSGLQIRVDGVLKALGSEGIDLSSCDCEANEVQSSGRIQWAADEESIEILYANGTRVVVTPAWWANQQKWYLNVNIYDTTASEGVMGRIADDSWIPALSDGSNVGPKADDMHNRYVQLYETFADSWRVTDAASLFDYAPGTSTASFTDDSWPRENPSNCLIEGETTAETVDETVAEEACENVLDANNRENCVFDVRETGHTGFADAYERSEQLIPGATRTLLVADKSPSMHGTTVTFTASVMRMVSTVAKVTSGNVQFFINGDNVGSPVQLDDDGEAIWSTSALPLGSHRVEARFHPSGFGEMFRPSSSPEVSHIVKAKNDENGGGDSEDGILMPDKVRLLIILLVLVIIGMAIVIWWYQKKVKGLST